MNASVVVLDRSGSSVGFWLVACISIVVFCICREGSNFFGCWCFYRRGDRRNRDAGIGVGGGGMGGGEAESVAAVVA